MILLRTSCCLIDLNEGTRMDNKREHITLYLFIKKEMGITKTFWYVHTTMWLLLVKEGTILYNTLLISVIY